MKMISVAALSAALLLAGCGGGAAENKTAPAANAAVPAAVTNEAVPAGETAAPAAADGAAQDFTIVNKTGHIVASLNVSPTSKDEWGPDILGSDVLRDGESGKITFDRAADECKWDLKATYDDGDTTEMKDVDLCEVATVTLNP
jgi:hypothetical protein